MDFIQASPNVSDFSLQLSRDATEALVILKTAQFEVTKFRMSYVLSPICFSLSASQTAYVPSDIPPQIDRF